MATGLVDAAAEAVSSELFRDLLESAPDAMVIVNGEGVIMLVNAQAEALFGYTRAELLGQPVNDLVPERFRGQHTGHRTDYLQSRRVRPMGEGLELFGRCKDGHEVPVEISLSPLNTPDGVLVSAAIRDVSERRRAAAELTLLYEQQRQVAVTLQHSLMRQPAEVPGVVTARRYLPATSGAGVGGDWFDLIGLGARRAGVFIGDVMGRGLDAAAVMGELRSAGNALARTGLSPRRLMQTLDAVVTELPDQLATCCYLEADWDVGELTVTSAGHLPVLAVSPAGGVEALPVPVGVPLGVGGVPYYQVRVPVPTGSTLAFYTDGLVESRGRDIEVQIKALAVELETAFAEGLDLERTADRILAALLPDQECADDDVTLLLVRLPEPSVAVVSLRLAAEPQAVRQARHFVADTMAAWGCDDDSVETVRLLVSELVTNAMQNSEGPLSLCVRDGGNEVTIEVTDRSTYALPSPGSPPPESESGRGLVLLDALADRWGTSPVDDGKTVWFAVGTGR